VGKSESIPIMGEIAMKPGLKKHLYRKSNGVAILAALIFIAIFATLGISMAALSTTNAQLSSEQRLVNNALSAAQSGLDCARYIITQLPAQASTGDNTVTAAQADTVWASLCSKIQSEAISGKTVTIPTGSTEVNIPSISFGSNAAFTIKFIYDSSTRTISVQSTGTDGQVSRCAAISTLITKDAGILNYAIASKARVWITGDSTIHGNIYSSWKYQNISPFNITSDSTVEGSINTILTNIKPSTGEACPDLYAGTTKMPYDLETLDADGNPVYDAEGNKVISSTDEIQGQSDGINYGVNYGDKAANMPGMKLSDYDTTQYKNQTTAIASSYYNTSTITEYSPHSAGNYNLPASSGSLKLTRYVCENKTLTNAMVVAKKNTLFKNCTFNGILYVDGGTSSNPNNVRFDNCVFNGPIVTKPSTDTSSGWWQRNQLYFTGAATFQNQTDVPATILAPNFSVDIGNTNPTTGDNNVLTGAIVGGIVDIRGHAEVYGTIVSMFDTSSYNSGYVSNIGATLGDGGSETTDPGDVGVINITPDPDKMLPSGITTPIVIKPLQNTYSEL
jgi:Tfp pilus assembly protein PilX